jgi:hypothetical protein
MSPEDIRAFTARSWEAVATAKRAHWQAVLRQDGAAAVARAADALREHVERFAGAALDKERRADWEHHLELKRRLDAASNRLGR